MVDAGDIATSAPMCQHRQRIATPQETTTTASPSYVGGIAATKGRHAVRDNSNGTVNVLATATTVCFCSAAQTAATVASPRFGGISNGVSSRYRTLQ